VAPIVASVEIARSPEDVFAYVGQLDRHGEWQAAVERVEVHTEGPTRVGTRATDVRRVPMGKMKSTYEMTEWDPPRRAVFRGLNGPIRANGVFSVEPAGEGRSKATIELDFEAHGIGKLLLPLVRREAAKRTPEDQQALKARLEAGV
jgi:uncharacterized protein YndB with AHSA1/START domain